MLKISDAAKELGVHPQTIRRWEKEGKITSNRTVNGQRRYQIEEINKLKKLTISGKGVIYCRVSSKKQEVDLQRQIEFMQKLYPDYELITDVCPGVTFKRQGLQTILERLSIRDIQTIAVAHKDRIARVGFTLFESIATIFGCKIIVVDDTTYSPEEELVEDLISLTTSFSARIHGLRKYTNKIKKYCSSSEETIETDLEKVDETCDQNLQQDIGSNSNI